MTKPSGTPIIGPRKATREGKNGLKKSGNENDVLPEKSILQESTPPALSYTASKLESPDKNHTHSVVTLNDTNVEDSCKPLADTAMVPVKSVGILLVGPKIIKKATNQKEMTNDIDTAHTDVHQGNTVISLIINDIIGEAVKSIVNTISNGFSMSDYKTDRDSQNPVSEDGMKCKACNFASYYPGQMKLHLQTPKHRKNQTLFKITSNFFSRSCINKVVKSTDEVTEILKPSNSEKSTNNEVQLLSIESQKLPIEQNGLKCNICDVSVLTPKNMFDHLNGNRHKKRFEKYNSAHGDEKLSRVSANGMLIGRSGYTAANNQDSIQEKNMVSREPDYPKAVLENSQLKQKTRCQDDPVPLMSINAQPMSCLQAMRLNNPLLTASSPQGYNLGGLGIKKKRKRNEMSMVVNPSGPKRVRGIVTGANASPIGTGTVIRLN